MALVLVLAAPALLFGADSTIEAAWIGVFAVVLAAMLPSVIAAWRIGPRLGHGGSVTDQIAELQREAYFDRGLLHAIALELGLDPDRPETWPTNRRRRR